MEVSQEQDLAIALDTLAKMKARISSLEGATAKDKEKIVCTILPLNLFRFYIFLYIIHFLLFFYFYFFCFYFFVAGTK
jgi:hypothetical protein